MKRKIDSADDIASAFSMRCNEPCCVYPAAFGLWDIRGLPLGIRLIFVLRLSLGLYQCAADS
jgi:hypothetical protein